MRRQFTQQLGCLLSGQEPDAPGRFFQQAHGWGAIEPVPIPYTAAQDCSQKRQRPVDRRITAAFDSLRLRDRIDECSIDALELTIGKMSIEPAQLAYVLLVSRLVCLLLEPAFRGVLPDPRRPVTKSVHAPGVTSELIVQLLCLASVTSLSRLSDSFAV